MGRAQTTSHVHFTHNNLPLTQTPTQTQTTQVFDPKAEAIFAYLQVFSAICVMFAHGAGEGACVRGPFTCVVVYLDGFGRPVCGPVASGVGCATVPSLPTHPNPHPPSQTTHTNTTPVGYMAGPLATIYDIYKSEAMTKKIAAPIWVVFISAFSLVVGLATYGYNM